MSASRIRAALAVLSLLLLAGCSQGAPFISGGPSIGSPQAPAEPAVIVPGYPDELQGMWCTRLGSDECFSLTDITERFPDTYLSSERSSDEVPGASDYTLCLQLDGPSCTTAASVFLRYFPAGVEWDCQDIEVSQAGWPDCDPDFTSDHDSSVPRLVQLLNHQQDVNYADVPPMYLVG